MAREGVNYFCREKMYYSVIGTNEVEIYIASTHLDASPSLFVLKMCMHVSWLTGGGNKCILLPFVKPNKAPTVLLVFFAKWKGCKVQTCHKKCKKGQKRRKKRRVSRNRGHFYALWTCLGPYCCNKPPLEIKYEKSESAAWKVKGE